jgi:flagellar biosynthesis GTPase FlhF
MKQARAAEQQTLVDDTPSAAVQLGFSVFNPNVKVDSMTDKTQASEAKKAEREAAKAAKLAEREAAKAEREAAKAAKLAEREAAKAARQAAREAARAERAAKLAELGEQPKMAALRSAKGRYVKAKNGSLRSDDEIAQAFDGLEPDRVITTCMNLLGLSANPYAHLNVGQQSMNLRNKLRTAVKRGVISIDAVRAAVQS